MKDEESCLVAEEDWVQNYILLNTAETTDICLRQNIEDLLCSSAGASLRLKEHVCEEADDSPLQLHG